jgi:hypothetical protein
VFLCVHDQIPDFLVKSLPPYFDSARAMFRDGVLPFRKCDEGSCLFVVFAEHPRFLICVACDGFHMRTVQHVHVVAHEVREIEMGRYDGVCVSASVCVGGTDGSPACSGHVVVAMPDEYREALTRAMLYFRSLDDE